MHLFYSYDAHYKEVYNIYFIQYMVQTVTMQVKVNDPPLWDLYYKQ
jgi:hypothetical protein